MKPIREPQGIDLVIQSGQWSDEDTADFRIVMRQIKAKKSQKRVIVAGREIATALF